MDKKAQTVRRKAVLGLVWLIVILGLALFIPSGTLDFWEAWVYLFIFGASSLLITLFLMKNDMGLLMRRVHAGAAAEKEKTQKIIQSFASFIFIGILIVPGFDHRFKWSDVPLYIVIAGEIFVGVGFFIVFLAFRENTFASAAIETAHDQTVVSTGPYAIVRHPMYSGALLLLIFTPPALGSYVGLVFVGLMIIVIVLRLLDEEKFLSKNLPGYFAYCNKIRYRLIPLIW
jgi:protein-S-isoprenylcysteine O-methyltransferase Ste14